MNIVILSRNGQLYSTRRLCEAALARGHETQLVDCMRCVLDVRTGRPDLYFEGTSLRQAAAVIPRIGASVTRTGLAVLRQFHAMGIPTLTSAEALANSRDKLRCLQLLAEAGISVPHSSFSADPESHPQLTDLLGGAPLVLKLLEGAHGRGVMLGETASACDSQMDTLRTLQADFIAQRFIAESEGTDLRCFVVGDEVVAAIERRAAKGEFRANLHKGGRASPVPLTTEESDIAVRAAKAVGLPVAGIDLLRSANGPLVIEVNSSPGLEGIEAASGVDIASRIIETLEAIAARGHV